MPLIKHKRTILDAIRSVILAPFVFILVGIVSNWWKLLLIAILLPLMMWSAGESFASLMPSQESLIVWGGVICAIAIAAIPLAIRDYFAGGGYETSWVANASCEDAARRSAELVIRDDYSAFYDLFATSLKSQVTFDELITSMAELHSRNGRPTCIIDCTEVEIPHDVYDAPEYDSQIDAIVQVVFEHRRHDLNNILTVFLNCREEHQIVEYEYVACNT